MADTDEGAFCGTAFWDDQVTWNTTEPDFTPCFQKTVLTCTPVAFLLLLTPYKLYNLCHCKDRLIRWNWLNCTKLAVCGLAAVAVAVQCLAAVVRHSKGSTVPPVDFFSPFVLILGIVLAIYFISLDRRKGVRTSGYLVLFWLLLLFNGIIMLRTRIRQVILAEKLENEVDLAAFGAYFLLVLVSFVLSALVDQRPEFEQVQQDTNPCPECGASFLSRITFWWFTGLVITGYKRALERADLWSLNKEDTSAAVKAIFMKHWNAQIHKIKSRSRQAVAVETQPEALYKDGKVSAEVRVVDGVKARKPSLLKTLVRSFSASFFISMGFKLIHDLLMFVSPQILKYLIEFVQDRQEYVWRGYMYAVILVLVALLQSMVLHQYFHGCFVLGMQLRSVIVSAVYRKTLKLSSSAKKVSTVGEIVNLMSVDAQRFMDLMTYFHTIWSGPLQIVLSLYFLWHILGPSVFAGVGVMVLLIPINAYIAYKTRQLQVKQMVLKDSRIKLMNEVLNGIKVLKLYAWEVTFQQHILGIRHKELEVLKKSAYLNACSSFTWSCAPFLVSLTTFAVYTLSDSDNVLDAKKAFVSLSLFNIMRFPMSMLPNVITNIVQASVSLKRLQRFLDNDELDANAVLRSSSEKSAVKIVNGTFTWDRDTADTISNLNLEVEEGSLVAVVGTVGAGKSSLLSALLGEMDRKSGIVNIKGSVAYMAQQAWIQNATLQDNIVFHGEFRQRKYDKVVSACALQQDLDMLPAGDQTEIGEKGINLSGGQKQRVSLARATYFDADVYLLDDPLSAVDSHVGKHIFDNVIGPEGMLRHKTRILVTHGIGFLPQVDKIVVLKGGKVSEVGSFTQLMDHNGAFAEFLRNYLSEEVNLGGSSVDPADREVLSMHEDIISHIGSPPSEAEAAYLQRQISAFSERLRSASESHGSQLSVVSVGKDSHKTAERQASSVVEDRKLMKPNQSKEDKLIQAEGVETGRVKFSVFLTYLKAVGACLCIIILLFYILYNVASIYANIWLAEWSNDANQLNVTNDADQRNLRLGVYGALGFLQGVFIWLAILMKAFGARIASGKLHANLLTNVFHLPMMFFDTTPIGRVVNRFSKDVDCIDVTVPSNLEMFVGCLMKVVATIVVVSMTTPLILTAVVPLAVAYFLIQRFYVATSRQLKRLESTSRSPIYSHFGETITGASTIRAFQQEGLFIQQSESRVDENQVCYYPSIVSNRWLAIRLEFVGNCIIFFASLFAVVGRENLSPGTVGLSVSYAMNVTQTLNWMVRMTCELETNVVAVERVKEYTETPTEADWEIPGKKPEAAWPQNGVIKFKDYQTRYREGLDLVLRGISCSVNPGEKIGIVGRTGAGKSSLTLALFRIIEAAGGEITIDDINISDIGLHDLRSKLTIIPQDPVVFSGTLRMNLDPFDSHSDEDLWQALDHAHLRAFVQGLTAGLHHLCTEGGENLSVGQRQLLCLARALLRKTKVLILDEATAAVDLETDDLIQATIRTEFADCTVLTIAHRLHTIMDYTRIMVLDAGQIAEFDDPQTLLQNPDSIFYGMAKDAGLD